jgi:serine/threonine protein kinase
VTDEVLVGKLVADRYRVVRRLGAGGMGTVYVAVQEPLGREVALKVVRRELAGEKRTLERFRREAKSLSTAHHPHIVTLYDFGELPSGALWFAMELVRGEDLRQRLNRDGPLPVRKTINIVRDAASALAAAHAMGIIHRDLKPENILLMEAAGRPDFVKLVDFGVAKLPVEPDADPAEQHLTMRGMVVGTPGYIAPEVALHDVSNDPRSDLYALGVVWFECLAGRAPYRARTATALMMLHATEAVPPLPPEVPLPIAGLVQRLLAKSPDDRPASAEAFLAALDALPPFDQGATPMLVPRPPLVGGAGVGMRGADPSAATLDDSSRQRSAPGSAPLSMGPGNDAGFGKTAGWGADSDDATARVGAAPAPFAPVPTPSAHTVERSVAVTEPAMHTPVPPTRPSRTPLVAAALIVIAVVALIALAAIRLGRTSEPATRNSDSVDAGVADVVAAPPIVDAGAQVVDAGSRSSISVDAGPAAKKVKKKKGPNGTPTIGDDYEPDLSD